MNLCITTHGRIIIDAEMAALLGVLLWIMVIAAGFGMGWLYRNVLGPR